MFHVKHYQAKNVLMESLSVSNLITIELNNVVYRVKKTHSILSFLALHKVDTQGCALAMSNQIIPRSEWQTRALSDGESISLFQAIAGG